MEIACPSSHWHMATLARNLEWKKRTNHFLQTCKPDPISPPHADAKVAVKIVDMLGEEVIKRNSFSGENSE